MQPVLGMLGRHFLNFWGKSIHAARLGVSYLNKGLRLFGFSFGSHGSYKGSCEGFFGCLEVLKDLSKMCFFLPRK